MGLFGFVGFGRLGFGVKALRFGAQRYRKGPCTQIVDTLAPKYLYRDYFAAAWVQLLN